MRHAVFALTLAAAVVAAAASAAAQDPSDPIYSESTFGTFTLTLDGADWNAICYDGTGSGDQWKRGTMTWTNGTITETVSGVGIKRAGKYSAGIDTPKPGVRISFNEFEFAAQRRKWRGVNRIKLDSMIGNTDLTMMRDRLAYWTFGQFGAPASRACHAELVVNGDSKGVYTVEEPVKEPFAMYRWGEHDGNLYELGYGADRPYHWVGSNPASYVPSKFVPENNFPGGDYTDIVRLVDIVNNNAPSQIPGLLNGHINLDAFYNHVACQVMIADTDGLAHWSGGGHVNNHSWYHRSGTNKLELIKWDPGASQGLYDSVAFGNFPKGQSPMFYQFDGVPLVRWIETDPTANAAVKAKIRSLVNGPYASGVLAKIDSIYNQIRTAVYADRYKGISPNQGSPAPLPNGFTDAEFDAARDWLKDWYVRRIAYLRSQVGGGPPPTLPTVTITASDPNAAEPSSVGAFTVTRTGPTTSDLSVDRPRTGTATSGVDFNALPAPIVIPAGQASVVVPVTPIDDTLVEGPETVILTLSSTATYTVGAASSATVTIADDDTAPPPTLPTVTITASDPNAAEPSVTGAFTVSRTGPTTTDLSVWRTRTGTATNLTDFNQLPNPMVIPAGQSSVVVTLTPIDDTAVEGNETVILTLDANAAYTVGTASSATVTIADNDGVPPPPTLPTVTITASDPNAAEPSATGAFTVSRTGATTADLSVWRTRTGTATNGTDFNQLPNPMLIPAGQSSVVVTLTPIDDTAVEGNETVILTLDANAAYTVGTASSATVTIADNDGVPPPPTLPTVTIAASDPNAAEPSNAGAFTVSRTGPTTADLSVWRTRTGTATNGTDFNQLPNPMVIPAGQSSVTITMTPIDDTAVEGNETVILTLDANAAYTVGTASSATVTIADNDAAGTGLSATYYDNDDFTGASVTRTDPTIDFDWAGGSPAPAIAPETFSSRWTGRLKPQYTETYTFYTFTNDGVRLWVEGEFLVDKWVQQSGGIEWNAQVALEAGRWYTVQMDHYEGTGNAVARLSWSSPSTPKEVIPQAALDPALGAADSRDNDGDGIPNDADLDDDNDGIPDLQDPDRDGDTLTNLAEIAAGSDPNDRTSPNAGGGPPAASGSDNDNGDGWVNDKCGGSIPAGETGSLIAVALLVALLSWERRRKSP